MMMLITLVLLPVYCGNPLTTNASLSLTSNSTAEYTTIMEMATSLPEPKDAKATVNNLAHQWNKTLRDSQSSPRSAETVLTSNELTNVSCAGSINECPSFKEKKPNLRKQNTLSHGEKSLDLIYIGNQTQEPSALVGDNLDTSNASTPVTKVERPNKTLENFFEKDQGILRENAFTLIPGSNFVKQHASRPLGGTTGKQYWHKKTNGTGIVSGNSKNRIDYEDAEISTWTREHFIKCSEHEKEIECEDTEKSTSTQEVSFIKSSCGNETDCEDTEISTSTQEVSLIKSRCGNETDCEDTATLTAIQNHSQNRHSPKPAPVTSPDIFSNNKYIDLALILTCQGRCGKKISFPCSCSATCVVYGTCCDNMTQDCPHILQEGLSKFDHIRRTDYICDKDDIYKFISCPKPGTTGVERKEIGIAMGRMPTENVILKTENQLSFGLGTTPKIGKLVGLNSTTSTASGREFQESIIQRFNKALSLAPVTDSATGFTFINKAIYDCHNMPESTAMPWSLKLDYTFKSPSQLEDFAHSKTLNEYWPKFSHEMFTAHLCMQDVIETCNGTADLEDRNALYEKKCQENTAVLRSRTLPDRVYRNKFCAYCHEGMHGEYLFALTNKAQFKTDDFYILMSISNSKTINVQLGTLSHLSDYTQLPWSHAKCSFIEQASSPSGYTEDTQSSESERLSTCSVTCGGPSFSLRSDGQCKTHHEALLAIADDGLPPLCPAGLTALAKFLVCSLESEVENLRNADLSALSVATMFDSSSNKSLYVVKIYMALPQVSSLIFSNSKSDILKNIHHVALVAKSFKNYRLSNNICSNMKERSRNVVSKVIYTKPLGPWVSNLGNGELFSKSMEELRGRVVNKQTTTTVCLSSVNSLQEVDPNFLYCLDDPVYERDAAWISKFRTSPCFSHLEVERLESQKRNKANRLTKSGGASIKWILILHAVVAAVIKTLEYTGPAGGVGGACITN
ncbi:hypothetical protein PoB_002997900 [Plakobranchus ocellatus]|uniref:SMB domain-containing protein n=1 Tax=Plakobranchus ocellatus TaxID=259542 RepID=A0AAV4AAJ1_9GAST|nr:hypothetical protein PoB_002997900 [Plakobranchus ocellatus]